jgi:hypothetical protein
MASLENWRRPPLKHKHAGCGYWHHVSVSVLVIGQTGHWRMHAFGLLKQASQHLVAQLQATCIVLYCESHPHIHTSFCTALARSISVFTACIRSAHRPKMLSSMSRRTPGRETRSR